MKSKISALLVCHQPKTLGALRIALENQLIRTVTALTCQEASNWLHRPNPPHLVFTDVTLPDGTWADVLDLADRALEPVNVIVVSPTADVDLYIDVTHRGAFDFITDSFTPRELRHVVRCAADRALKRRKPHSLSAMSSRGKPARQAGSAQADSPEPLKHRP